MVKHYDRELPAAVSTFSIHMFMLWSDWSGSRRNKFGYRFYKVRGGLLLVGVGRVVGYFLGMFLFF